MNGAQVVGLVHARLEKGELLKVPEPFYHSTKLPGFQNAGREQNREESHAKVEHKFQVRISTEILFLQRFVLFCLVRGP